MALAGCAGSTVDPWVGVYIGETSTEARDCDTGEPQTPEIDPTTVRLERDERGLFINGRCLLRLDELSDVSASVVPTRCDTSLGDGTPVRYEVLSGRARLSGDRLVLEWATDLTAPGVCFTASSRFEGYR